MISAVQIISRPSNANTLQTFKLFLTRLSGCSSHKWIRKKFLISEEAHELSHPPSSDYRIFLCFLGSGCKDKREQMNQVQSMLSSEKGGIEGVGGWGLYLWEKNKRIISLVDNAVSGWK